MFSAFLTIYHFSIYISWKVDASLDRLNLKIVFVRPRILKKLSSKASALNVKVMTVLKYG